ncbi:glycosyltransferase family 2 protein [Solitalea koreensis]|nr:glycosyltransferase family 2 protein [Solitalea koreensis]
MNTFSCSLIISTYNWPEALALVFKSIAIQTVLPNEIIIADDGSNDETRNLINSFQKEFPIPLIHVWHEDNGFRKTIIMNTAISKSLGDYIIQIDGDIILHSEFIKDHLMAAKNGFFIRGSRTQLLEEKSKSVINNQEIHFSPFEKGIKNRLNATHAPLLSFLVKGNPTDPQDVIGCNMAFWKKDFINVNGYDNNIEGWGHEDIELAARLVNSGVKKRHLKFAAVCYHIFHKPNARHNEENNKAYFYTIWKNGVVRCKNGYSELSTTVRNDH